MELALAPTMMTKTQIASQEIARRRGVFERHVAECENCNPAKEGMASIGPNDMCMSGMITFRNFMVAIRTANPIVTTEDES